MVKIKERIRKFSKRQDEMVINVGELTFLTYSPDTRYNQLFNTNRSND